MVKMKKGILIIIFIGLTLLLFILAEPKYNYPEEFKLNVTHVGAAEEHEKMGTDTGGFCWTACLTMLLKQYDSNIEYWMVHNFREASTKFNFFYATTEGNRLWADSDAGGTKSVLLAAKNLGYTPHLRIRNPTLVYLLTWKKYGEAWQIKNWIKFANELGVDVDTFIIPPWDLVKHLISSGIPVQVDVSSCFYDYHVIEGYDKENIYIVVPDPEFFGLESAKKKCKLMPLYGLRFIWLTKDGKRKSDEEILSSLRWRASLAVLNMRHFVKLLKQGKSIYEFDGGRFSVLRRSAYYYLKEQSLEEVASLYNKSAELFKQLHLTFPSTEAEKHKEKIIETLTEIADIEEKALEKWPSPMVSKYTNSLNYSGIRITSKEKANISVFSQKEDLPKSFKLVYGMYVINTTKPLSIYFIMNPYVPSGYLMKGDLKIIRKEGGKFIELKSKEKTIGDEWTLEAQIKESGEYGVAVRTSSLESCGNGVCELGESNEDCSEDCI